ncbi:MAG: double-strand break repair protein AddB [Alsobacter sp.]
MCADRPRLFSIQPGAAFLPTLADALLAGRLAPGWPDPADPLSLAEGTILLPTRRSARALAALLAEKVSQDGRPVLLPRIVPLGDVDDAEEAHLLDGAAAPLALADAPGPLLPPDTPDGVRRLVLARLVLAWARNVDRSMLRLEEGEALLVPAGPADALALAGDLGRLMDTLAIHGKSVDDLHRLVPDDFSAYWAISRNFLLIAAEAWPAWCAEHGTMDAALRRHRLLTDEAARLLRERPSAPVIAAGSTGSMPATASLLQAIALLPRGAVVLPGLDQGLDEAGWRVLGGDGPDGDHPGHPQSVLARLLRGFGVAREEVVSIGHPAAALAAREAFLSEALRPAETTELWATRAERLSDEALAAALEGLAVVEAADDREEALAIAVALREALETPGQTAALVTPDRALAERVSAELRRWGVEVDDSAGRPLARSEPGALALLVAEASAAQGEPTSLIALLAHPLCRLGLPPALRARGRAALEIGLLRGPALPPGLAALRPALRRAAERAPSQRHAPWPRKRLGPQDWAAADALLAALEAALAGFGPAALPGERDLVALVPLHEAALAAVTEPGPGEEARPSEGDAEDELAALFDEARQAAGLGIAGAFDDYPGFFAALMAGRVTRRPNPGHRRLRIWGPLESRLLHSDLVILGGLDEKTWPPETRGDAFLNRPLREQLALPALERRLGQTAHDFVQALGAPRAILTRAAKRGGDPTVPSRFLQRMRAVAGDAAWRPVLARGEGLLPWVRQLDRPERVSAVPRPAPRPARELQPLRLSVTEVETLVRDPYAIYAKHVLKLDPLDDLAMPPGAALRGTLVHDVLGDFAKAWPAALPPDPQAELLAVAKTLFDALPDLDGRPDIRAFWWPRLVRTVAFLAEWEAARRARGMIVAAEIGGVLALALPDGATFELTARADRIERRASGGVAIIDFKTGAVPGLKEVQVGFSPQLTLEAAMAMAGVFPGIPAEAPIEALTYVHLAAGRGLGREVEVKPGERAESLEALARQHLDRLVGLLAELRAGERAFLSRPAPKFARRYAPYDHLARVREWSLLGPDGSGGEEA